MTPSQIALVSLLHASPFFYRLQEVIYAHYFISRGYNFPPLMTFLTSQGLPLRRLHEIFDISPPSLYRDYF